MCVIRELFIFNLIRSYCMTQWGWQTLWSRIWWFGIVYTTRNVLLISFLFRCIRFFVSGSCRQVSFIYNFCCCGCVLRKMICMIYMSITFALAMMKILIGNIIWGFFWHVYWSNIDGIKRVTHLLSVISVTPVRFIKH